MDLITCCIAAIGLHVGSAHVDPYPDAPRLRGANPGAYVEFTNHVVLGSFRNSIGRSSVYLAYNWSTAPVAGFTPSLVVGGITGYPGASVSLLVLPSLYAPVTDRTGLRLSYIPKTRATLAHVLHLSFEYRF